MTRVSERREVLAGSDRQRIRMNRRVVTESGFSDADPSLTFVAEDPRGPTEERPGGVESVGTRDALVRLARGA